MFIIISKPNTPHNLGHEIHYVRKLLLLLLHNNYINNNNTIVTIFNDRKFLYSNIFNNVLSWNEFHSLNINDDNEIIDLSSYLTLNFANKMNITDDLNKLLKYSNINNKSLFDIDFLNKPCNNDFMKLCCNLNFINLNNIENTFIRNTIKTKFCIIHIKKENTKTENDIIIEKIINSITDIKIIIFTELDKYTLNENTINNLHLYSSLMNHPNCEYVISEWSGGGQMSQYCCNSKIYYYLSFYTEPDIDEKSNFINTNFPMFDNQQNWYDIIYKKTIELEKWCNNNPFTPLSDHFNPSNVKRIFLLKKDLINFKF